MRLVRTDDAAIARAQSRRRAYRSRLLDRNAFLWLALRERGKPFYAWFLVLFFMGLFGWVGRYFPNLIFDMPINIALLLTLHFTLKLWMASEVCHRLVQDRRAGALELLLSTPLRVREIARGQAFALRRIFAWPVAILVVGEIAAALWVLKSGLQRPSPLDRALTYAAASSTLLLDAWALNWAGQWRALRGKSVERVLAATLVIILAIPWIAYITIFGVASLLEAFAGMKMSYRAHLLAWWTLSVIWSCTVGWSARMRYLKNFREYAASRFESAPAGGARHSDVTARKPPPASWRPADLWRWNPAVFLGVVTILGCCLFGCARKFYWRHQLRSEARKVQKEGFPASMSEMTAYLGLSDPAHGYKDAYPLLAAAGNPGQPFLVNFSYRLRAYTPGLANDLRSHERQLAAVRSLTNYTELRVPMTSQIDFGSYGMLACADYVVAAQDQDAERAYADMAGLFKLIGLLRHCGLENAQPYAASILVNVMQVLQANPILRDDQLVRLDGMIDEMDSSTALQQALVLHRAPLLDPGFGQMTGG
jgi:hypothetical protein